MISYTNPAVADDLKVLYQATVKWELLKNKTIMVTGATGMLASWFTFMLMYLNEHKNYQIRLLLLARNRDKLNLMFGKESDYNFFLVQDVCKKITLQTQIDYIFHAAGSASPYYILNDPAGVAQANTIGTINVLELARKTNTRKVVFTSTREVYGKVEGIFMITENDMGIIDPLDPRSCYPESKRMAETLLKSYSIQHGIYFNTLRIAHVYGPGMQIENDGRIMADLLNDAVNRRDIHLKSDGTAVRAFCYITDAVEAIFRILTDGKKNEPYNIANESEPVTILELARLIQSVSGDNKRVFAKKNEEEPVPGYCNYKRVKLDTSKTESLGWRPKILLSEGIYRTYRIIP